VLRLERQVSDIRRPGFGNQINNGLVRLQVPWLFYVSPHICTKDRPGLLAAGHQDKGWNPYCQAYVIMQPRQD
jgi:hypothetical protein